MKTGTTYKITELHWYFKKGFYIQKIKKNTFVVSKFEKFENFFSQEHDEIKIDENDIWGWEQADWIILV